MAIVFDRSLFFWVGLLLIVIGAWILFSKLKGIVQRKKTN